MYYRPTLTPQRLIRFCWGADAKSKESRSWGTRVTNDNLQEALPAVQAALQACQFFAFDLEMTGLFVRDGPAPYLDEIEDRYRQMRDGAQNFQITQFGLSAFVWEPPAAADNGSAEERGSGRYLAHTFNFWIFPRGADDRYSRRFLSQASSLRFLADQGFDFNRWVRDGIGYMTADERDARLAELKPAAGKQERAPIAVFKEDDVAFVDQLVQQVTAWLQGSEPRLELPAVNSYLRRLQQEYLGRNLFGRTDAGPGFYVQTMRVGLSYVLVRARDMPTIAKWSDWYMREKVDNEEGDLTLVLVRATEEDIRQWQASEAERKRDAIMTAAGFAAVFEMMRASKKPAVGHNLSLDLAFSLAAFAQPLPLDWKDYKLLVASWFVDLYDTKLLARHLPGVFEGDTSLGQVYDAVVQGSRREQGPDAASFSHEAGFDAWMTGACFARLLSLYQAAAAGNGAEAGPGLAAVVPQAVAARLPPPLEAVASFSGRMALSRTDLPYADLLGPDPVPDRAHVFFVSSQDRPFDGHSAVSAAFWQAGLGRTRVTMQRGGRSAWVELQDAEVLAAPDPAALVTTKLAGAPWDAEVLPYATWVTTRKFAQPAIAQAGAGDNGVRRNGLAAMASRRQQSPVGRVLQPDRLADAVPSAKRRRCGPQPLSCG